MKQDGFWLYAIWMRGKKRLNETTKKRRRRNKFKFHILKTHSFESGWHTNTNLQSPIDKFNTLLLLFISIEQLTCSFLSLSWPFWPKGKKFQSWLSFTYLSYLCKFEKKTTTTTTNHQEIIEWFVLSLLSFDWI